MPRRGAFQNPYTGEDVSPDQFANYLGDPQGDSSFDEELNWAKGYAQQHPDWTGNGAGTITASNGNVKDTRGWLDKHTGLLIGLGMAATGGIAGLSGAFSGAGSAAGAGSAGVGAGSSGGVGLSVGVPSNIGALGSSVGFGSVGGGSSMGGWVGMLAKLKAAGIDPTTLGLGTLETLLAKDPQRLRSYADASGPASQLVNPVQALYNALAASDRLGVGLSNMLNSGVSTPSSFVAPPPKPVSIPGLNFQIGGGLATDPAYLDRSLLSKSTGGDLYTSALPGGPNMPPGSSPPPKRRTPGGGQ